MSWNPFRAVQIAQYNFMFPNKCLWCSFCNSMNELAILQYIEMFTLQINTSMSPLLEYFQIVKLTINSKHRTNNKITKWTLALVENIPPQQID